MQFIYSSGKSVRPCKKLLKLFYSILPNYCAGFGKNSWAITHLVV